MDIIEASELQECEQKFLSLEEPFNIFIRCKWHAISTEIKKMCQQNQTRTPENFDREDEV